MSSRSNRGTDFVNHQTAEYFDHAAHAHETGQLHGKQDHLTGREHARQEFDRQREDRQTPHEALAGHGIHAFGHEDIASLAFQLWQARGCPEGSPEVDWSEAVKELRTRALAHGEVHSTPENAAPEKVLGADATPRES
jgi:hypothetical protein